MTDTAMVSRKNNGPPVGPPLIDEQLADQLLGRAGRGRGAAGGAEPAGLPGPQRRDPQLRVEQALQAFTIYFDGRIPTP